MSVLDEVVVSIGGLLVVIEDVVSNDWELFVVDTLEDGDEDNEVVDIVVKVVTEDVVLEEVFPV